MICWPIKTFNHHAHLKWDGGKEKEKIIPPSFKLSSWWMISNVECRWGCVKKADGGSFQKLFWAIGWRGNRIFHWVILSLLNLHPADPKVRIQKYKVEPLHSRNLRLWNGKKILSDLWQHFSYLVDEEITEIWKKNYS